jgi:UPF0755 protein
MTNENRPVVSGKTIVLLVSILLVGLVLVATIGSRLIHEENTRLIGESDNGLSSVQTFSYDITFLLNQNKLLQSNESLPDSIIEIESDKPLDEVLTDLQNNKMVKDSSLLRKALIYTGADRKILPGKYPVPAGSSILKIAAILQDPNASLIDFVVLAGWRKEEIASVLPTSGLSIAPDDFLSITNQPVTDEGLLSLGVTGYEGFFSPGMYSFHRNITTPDFVNALTARFQSELTSDLVGGFEKSGLSVYQAVVIASIIQREAVHDEEKPVIASVFLNRINNGMPLQSDPTVQYALGFNPEWGWWKSPLSLDDLKTDSIYNTYIIAELPPTPISNPDMASLQAVAFPAETNYFYFRALCDGSKLHVFSETLEEHINNACP